MPSIRPSAAVASLCAGLLASTPAGAQDASGCLDALTVGGEPELVRETREALAGGLLGQLPASACAGATLEVTQDGHGLSFRLEREGRVAAHAVPETAAMVPWVESWLAPMAPLDTGGAAVTLAAEDTAATLPEPPAPEASPAPAAPPRDSPATTPGGLPIRIALRALSDLDRVGGAWPGGELALRVGLSPRVFLGVAAAAAWSPERAGVTRRTWRLWVRSGYLLPLSWGNVALGGGFGLASADARRRTQVGVYTDEESRPALALFVGTDAYLGEHWSLSLLGEVRAHLPDSYGGEGPATFEDDSLDPTPIAPVSATLQVGLAWDVERPR